MVNNASISKILLLSVLIINLNLVLAQKGPAKKPTKLETQSWLIDKMRTFGYCEGQTSNHYKIEFDGPTIQIRNELKSEFGIINSLSIFNITDIDYIYFSTYYNIFIFNIKLKRGKTVTTYFNGELQKPSDHFGFELNKSFNENNLPERTKKAFSRLIELNGGKSIITKEAY